MRSARPPARAISRQNVAGCCRLSWAEVKSRQWRQARKAICRRRAQSPQRSLRGYAISRTESHLRSPWRTTGRRSGCRRGPDVVHFNGMSGAMFFPEVAPGVGVLDFDNDGDLDLLLPRPDARPGRTLATRSRRGGRRRTTLPSDLRVNRQLAQAAVHGRDRRSGIDAGRIWMGVAVGGFDNNGWVDLYINFGRNQLFRNNGQDVLDVSKASGTMTRWSAQPHGRLRS